MKLARAVQYHAAVLAAVVTLAGPRSAVAQINLVGYYNPIFDEDFVERIPGPDIGDYAGLPITDAARKRANTWDASLLTLPEHQCKPHPSTYGFRGVGQLRIWEDRDPATQRLLTIHTHIQWQAQRREIWMDGRPHPSELVAHTWQGFSTGRFDGDVLVVRTTHLKAGWMRRNGLPLSDRATMTERFFRHGDLLTHVMMIEDPVYLTEPLVKSNGFQLIPNGTMEPYPCRPAVEVPRAAGEVPHHGIDDAAHLNEFPAKHRLPLEATQGGAETALPEYEQNLLAMPRRSVGVARQTSDAQSQPNAAKIQPATLPVQGNVYLLASGAGGNVTVQIGDDGVLVVDTAVAGVADALLAEIARISNGKPIRYIVNTHAHPDHVGGNDRFRRAGASIVAGNVAFDIRDSGGAAIIAHENVQRRLIVPPPNGVPEANAALPTETFFGDDDTLFFNGEAIELIHQPAAHTDGDVMVFFRKSDVISAGDIYTTTTYPFIDVPNGGTIDGTLTGLNRIIRMTVPRDKQEGGTMVIPGHGRISDEADVVEYRDMLTIVRDRVREMRRKGWSLEQVRAARPTSDYDGRYGATSGWTTDMFVEAIYRTLEGRRP